MDLLQSLAGALADRYAIDREIGRGGMATVYLARDLKHDRNVALKVLNPELGAVLGVERFLAEIKVTANLQHPNLLPLFDSGEAAGLLFYVMPYVQGESLRARIDHGALPAAESLGILRNMAQALAYAHERGIVHGDIKPENVFLSGGTAVVAEFGIANAISAARTAASSGAVTDPRADIYAWGVVAYELLAGEHPFAKHTTPAALAAAHLTEVPDPLAARAWGVPDAVSDLVMECLAKSPEGRPQTMAAVIDRMIEGQRVSTPMTTAEMRAAEAAEAIAKRPPPPPKRPRAPKPIPSATAEAHATSKMPLVIAAVVIALVAAIALFLRSGAR